MDYSPLRNTAKRILTQFGKSVSVVRNQSGGVYDPVAGVTSSGSTVTIVGVGVLLSYSRQELAGTDILKTDRKLYFSGGDLDVGDNYGRYRVVHVNRIDPDESGTILSIAQVRK